MDETADLAPIEHISSVASKPSGDQDDTAQDITQEKQPSSAECDVEKSSLEQPSPPPHSIFTYRQKCLIVTMISIASFFSPLSANIYFPALDTLSIDFNTTESIMNLTLTSYMIFQGLAPTIFGDFADMAGRRPAYIIGFIIYLAANAGIANSNTFVTLLILRCLQSTGSSSTIALGSAVVADISTSAERGTWMGWATSSAMFAPAIAPVLGGLFTQFLGWRWIFWFLLILAGTFVIPFALFVPETGRNVVGNGSIPARGWNMNLMDLIRKRRQSRVTKAESTDASSPPRQFHIPNPLGSLLVVLEKDVGLLLFYNSLVYCATYDIMTSAAQLLPAIYGLDALHVGLCFLPMGIGAFLASVVTGRLVDWNFRRTARRIGHEIIPGRATDLRAFPIELARVQIALPATGVGILATLGYGWAMDAEAHLAVPLVMTFFAGLALTAAFNTLSVLVVDLYPQNPATAAAANNLVRCLMGAGATAIVLYMIDAMGRGWCFTFIALVLLVLGPLLWVLQKNGPRWREARRVRQEAALLAAAERHKAWCERRAGQQQRESVADSAAASKDDLDVVKILKSHS